MSSPSAAAGGVLVSALWSYAANLLYPAQAMRRAGLAWWNTGVDGDEPIPNGSRGLGPRFSVGQPEPEFLDAPAMHSHLVGEFDRMAEVYQAFVEPFSRPIFDEALAILRRVLQPDARVLDAGCGPGRELQRVARLVPEGEVVGIDLAAGMVAAAHRATRAHGLENTAFIQADVGDLPSTFDSAFDVVYSSLAHHHYPDPPAATRAILRCLRPGGVYCVVDPGPEWFAQLSAPLARWADPGWIGFHTPVAFRRLFLDAGFVRAGWSEILPGFGVAVGQKAASGGTEADAP